jgi:hypothetical protein
MSELIEEVVSDQSLKGFQVETDTGESVGTIVARVSLKRPPRFDKRIFTFGRAVEWLVVLTNRPGSRLRRCYVGVDGLKETIFSARRAIISQDSLEKAIDSDAPPMPETEDSHNREDILMNLPLSDFAKQTLLAAAASLPAPLTPQELDGLDRESKAKWDAAIQEFDAQMQAPKPVGI